MLGAGGRDLGNEIQVRHSQITPPDLAITFQHTNVMTLCSIEEKKRQEIYSFKKVNCIIFVASGYNTETQNNHMYTSEKQKTVHNSKQ